MLCWEKYPNFVCGIIGLSPLSSVTYRWTFPQQITAVPSPGYQSGSSTPLRFRNQSKTAVLTSRILINRRKTDGVYIPHCSRLPTPNSHQGCRLSIFLKNTTKLNSRYFCFHSKAFTKELFTKLLIEHVKSSSFQILLLGFRLLLLWNRNQY